MANATALTRVKTVTREERVNDGVNLVLSKDEAETLLLVTRQIGGGGKRRTQIDAILGALRSAGVEIVPASYQIEGSLRFPSKSDNPFLPNSFITNAVNNW